MKYSPNCNMLTPLTKEEADALTKDLTEVLLKHGCELGVKSTIELLKRVEDTNEEGVPSPYGESNPPTEETPKTD